MKVKFLQLAVFAVCSFPLAIFGQTVGQSNANSSLSGQAQVFMQLQDMQNQINQLRGIVEEQQLVIKQLQQDSLDRYKELDKRLTTSNTQPITNTGGASNAIDASGQPTPPKTVVDKSAAADPQQEKLYYDASFSLIQKKDYPKAEQAFTAFLNKFPNSQYAGNALYWLAEVNLVQGNFQGASTNFNKVIQQYPDHNKVPDAMYKLATVQDQLGDKAKAKELLRQLITKYPSSSAATLAKRMLQTLN